MFFSASYDTCLPGQNTTFLYGYSNDLSPSTVDSTRYYLTTYLGFYRGLFKYVRYANVRFDLKESSRETIAFHDDLASFNASITANLPDPTLGFGDDTTGSDVAMVLRRFLANSPPCGTFILLSLHRKSYDTDLFDVIRLLQKHHISVYSFVTPDLIGNRPDAGQMYKMSSESNGLFIVDQVASIPKMTGDLLWCLGQSQPWYSTNLVVRGKGTSQLPVLDAAPSQGSVNMGITIQDHARTSDFNWMSILFESSIHQIRYNLTIPTDHGNCWLASEPFNFQYTYKVTLDYDYSGNEAQAVEIRVQTTGASDKWPPYSN